MAKGHELQHETTAQDYGNQQMMPGRPLVHKRTHKLAHRGRRRMGKRG